MSHFVVYCVSVGLCGSCLADGEFIIELILKKIKGMSCCLYSICSEKEIFNINLSISFF